MTEQWVRSMETASSFCDTFPCVSNANTISSRCFVPLYLALSSTCLLYTSNEFDWEMNRRGVKLVRYADDIVVLAKSERAAERLLE